MSSSPDIDGDNSDELILSGSSDITIDLGNYGAAQSTYIVDSIDLNNFSLDSMSSTIPYTITTTGTSGSGYTLGTGSYSYDNYTFGPSDAKVNIDADGVKIKEDGDLKIGDRSLKDFMDRVEDRLAILHPNEELEDKWEQLKDLRRQYEALEKDILEKEKIMKILKED